MWPAKSPPLKRTPLPGPWDSLLGKSQESVEPMSSDDLEGPPIVSSQRKKGPPKFPKQKAQTMGKLGVMLNVSHRDRKDQEAKQKRARQEDLHRKIAVDPLPQDVCEHELYTSWVSPVMRRVASEKDALSVLHKTSSDSFECKMKAKPFMSMPLFPTKDEAASAGNSARATGRAATAQGLGQLQRTPNRGGQADDPGGLGQSIGGASTGPRCNSRGHGASSGMPSHATKAASWGPVSGMLQQDMVGSFGGACNAKSAGAGREGNMLNHMRNAVLGGAPCGMWPHGAEARAVGGSKEMVLPGQTLPRVASAGGREAPVACGNALSPLILEPPSSLSHRIDVHRIESQGQAFARSTFSQYMKENDIFTGEPKVRFDEKRLRAEELQTLHNHERLVGGPAKRQLRLQAVDF